MHFLLDTPVGSLVLVLAAVLAVAVVVWWAVSLSVTLLALGLWRLSTAVQRRRASRAPTARPRVYRPGGNA